jgi:hypothetical protein
MLFLFLAAIPCIVGTGESEFACKQDAAAEAEKIPTPGVTMRVRGANTASATRAPWVDSNGWRFLRNPGGKYRYELPKGKAPLAAAEAFAYGVDARLQIAPEDAKSAADILAFLKRVPGKAGLRPAANIAVIDNNSPALPEVLNLMVRRNLLCRVVKTQDSTADLIVRLGSPEFPEAEAANPVAVADKARHLLTDKKRLIRIYGSEVVIGRLSTGPQSARLHLLNYGSSSAPGIRVRVLGSYRDIKLSVFGMESAIPEDVVLGAEATEFTVPEMGAYAVVDLR